MILSKANLEVIRVASREAVDRGLCAIRIEPDGSSVGGNGKIMMAVGPVNYAERLHWPEKAGDMLEVPVTGWLLAPDAISRIIKAIPRAGGWIFQHIGITRVKDTSGIGLTAIDPSGATTTIGAKPLSYRFPDWREAIRVISGEGVVGEGAGLRVCVNRNDIIELLDAIEAASPGKGGINPLFIEIGEDEKGLIIRSRNSETGQHIIGAIRTYDTRGKWLEPDAWENGVFGRIVKAIVRRIR